MKKQGKLAAMVAVAISLALGLAMNMPAGASTGGEARGSVRYEQMIAPQYEDAGLFSEGLAPVEKGGKWGYIDEKNNVVIPFEYDVAFPFSEGLAIVGKVGTIKYGNNDGALGGFMDESYAAVFVGRVDKSGSYKPLRSFGVDQATGQQGIIDHYVLLDEFDIFQICAYYGGWVYIGGLFDANGNQFKTADDATMPVQTPTEGLVPAIDPETEGRCCYLDMKGGISIDLAGKYTYFDSSFNPLQGEANARYKGNIDEAHQFNQGLAPVRVSLEDMQTGETSFKSGFINKSGKWAIAPKYDAYLWNGVSRYQVFMDAGLASVMQDGKFGAIDKTGKVVVPVEYDDLSPFIEGLAAFGKDGLYGYIDIKGNVAIEAKYTSATGFDGGCAIVFDGSSGRVVLIDRHGNEVQGSGEIDHDKYFRTLANGSRVTNAPGEMVIITGDGKYGYGKLTYAPPLPEPSDMDGWAFDEVTAAIERGLVPVRLQNMYRSRITRADYCSLIVHAVCAATAKDRDALVLEVSKKSMSAWVRERPFSDAFDSDIVAAFALGLVTGYEDGTFRPYSDITRQEAAVLLWRAAGLLGMDNADPPKSAFSDRASIPDWAVLQVDYVSSIGAMLGVGENTFAPKGFYTRQQSFMTVWRLVRQSGFL